MKREDLIKSDDFWKESLREMQILHWHHADLTIKEILKLKNELINSLSGETVKGGKVCRFKNCNHYKNTDFNRFQCRKCNLNYKPE